MRLEMTDLLEENAANADDEEDSDDDEVDRLFVAEFAGGCDSDEDDENFVCDAVDGGGVSMKCDILRAVTQDATEAVAPIAPLPTRLSFCLPSAAMASAQVPVRALATVCNEAAICEDAELCSRVNRDHQEAESTQKEPGQDGRRAGAGKGGRRAGYSGSHSSGESSNKMNNCFVNSIINSIYLPPALSLPFHEDVHGGVREPEHVSLQAKAPHVCELRQLPIGSQICPQQKGQRRERKPTLFQGVTEKVGGQSG
jgi:hypothetical protein